LDYSLEEDGLIDEMQSNELLIIGSYLNFMQNRTGLISNGYADITKCTRDDFVKFTKWADAMNVVYDEKEASVAQDRDAVICRLCYQHIVCYQHYRYQIYMVYLKTKSIAAVMLIISIYMEEAL
jgi:hypothetical protein